MRTLMREGAWSAFGQGNHGLLFSEPRKTFPGLQ